MTDATELIPPHDLEAEAELLSALFSDGKAIDVAMDLVSGGRDFFRPAHGAIYDAAVRMRQSDREVTCVTVADELGKSLELVGGKDYLAAIACRGCPTRLAKDYARIVRDLALLRRVSDEGYRIYCEGRAKPQDADTFAADALTAMMDAQGYGTHRSIEVGEMLRERCTDLTKPREFFTVPGFGGNMHLRRGDFTIVGGRPATGKSALALWWADMWSVQYKVAFYSYEMNEAQLSDRLLCMTCGATVEEVESKISEDDAALFAENAAIRYKHRHLTMKDGSAMTSAELFASLRRFAAGGGQIAVIDYLQLAADYGKHGRVHDVTAFTNGLKRTALQANLCVVGLSQFSRAMVDREHIKLPILSDLRDSGSLEQDADNACLLYAYPNPRSSEAARKAISEFEQKQGYDVMDLDGGTDDEADDPVLVSMDWQKVRQGKRRRRLWIFKGAEMSWREVGRS